MMRLLGSTFCGCWFVGMLALSCAAQVPGKGPAEDAAAGTEHAIELAAKGQCKEALPRLKIAAAHQADKQLKYRAGMATARCAMSLDQEGVATEALLQLKREYPRDPAVLYTITHYFSELASRSSQDLATIAPNSMQAQQLEAEAFESQEKWDEATALYKKILQANPTSPGIHYRLGRIMLGRNPPDEENANREFDEELKVDPQNASAEFMLGESARQKGQWDEAIARFSKASKLDEGFVEAYLALGMSLNSAGKFPEAIATLQTYVKMQPGDPAGHYQLATAYARSGRKPDADREMRLQQETAAQSGRSTPR